MDYRIFDPKNRNIKLFDENGNFDPKLLRVEFLEDIIFEAEKCSSLSCGIFIHDTARTNWACACVSNNKIKDIILITSVRMLKIKLVRFNGEDKYIYAEYSCNYDKSPKFDTRIPYKEFTDRKLEDHFNLRKLNVNKRPDLINDLLYELLWDVIELKNPENFIDIGNIQGWNLLHNGELIFESKNVHGEEVCPILPKSIAMRETPLGEKSLELTVKELRKIFKNNPKLFQVFLLRCNSLILYFYDIYRLYFDKEFVLHSNDSVTTDLITAELKTDGYQSLNTPSICGDLKFLKEVIENTNDGVVIAKDPYHYDNYSKTEKGIDYILTDLKKANSNNSRHITAIISNFAQTHIHPNDCVVISFDDTVVDITPLQIQHLMMNFDYHFLDTIKSYPQIINDLIIKHIDKHRNNWKSNGVAESNASIYIMLMTTLNVFEEMFGNLFPSSAILDIAKLLQKSDENTPSADDIVINEFSSVLNESIKEGAFKYISKRQNLIFEKKTNTIIVDKERLYVETSIVEELVKSKMEKVKNVELLTSILKDNEYLHINDKNSKCHRIHIYNEKGIADIVYTYGLSKRLVSPENLLKLELIDKEEFLYNPIDFPTNYIIPLIKTIDGRIAGKNINCENKSNNHIFPTGKSGRGKTYSISQLIPCFAMLGNRVVAFDVSGSFSKGELLRALPQDVVDNLFTFVCVGENECKVPVNLFDIKDCSGLSAKKRFVFNVLRAASSKLEKKDKRAVKSLISENLREDKNDLSLNTDYIRKIFEKDTGIGTYFLDLISDPLDDIDTIGMADTGWDELFINSNKVIVISLGNECGDSVHQLLDMMVASLFNYQTLHSSIPLTIAIDEIKDQDFTIESPLETIISQGRKYLINLIGATQHYVSQGNASIDKMKDANIKMFFQPSRSIERIANELGFNNSIEAGLNSMNIGDCIISCDFFNKVEGVNEFNVIKGRVVDFTETKLYEQFKREQAEIMPKDCK